MEPHSETNPSSVKINASIAVEATLRGSSLKYHFPSIISCAKHFQTTRGRMESMIRGRSKHPRYDFRIIN